MKIKVKPIFWIAAAVICLLGYGMEFFIMLLFAVIHEGGHITAAWVFGRKCKEVSITPIGVYAEIAGCDAAEPFEGICIAAAGPAVNIIIAGLCKYIGLLYIYDINVALAVFNLLIIYPLDGGRIVKYVCECFMGTISADKTVMRCAYIGAVLIMVIGILQTVLFPYNISLICLGKYLMKVIEKDKVWLGYRFFVKMKEKQKKGEVLRIKKFAVSEKTQLGKMLDVMGNWYYSVFTAENGEEISETEIIGYAEKNGISGSVEDLINASLKKRCD